MSGSLPDSDHFLCRLLPSSQPTLPPGQQLVAAGKWPIIGERSPGTLPEHCQLKVYGLVASPQIFGWESLRQLPTIRPTIDIHCVTRWSKLGVVFEGVLLDTLLRIVQPQPDARFISFISHSERKHSTSLSIETAIQQQTLIAWSANGEPLSIDHGGPLRNIVPGRYFYKSVKWLAEIELLAEDRLGFWEAESGYHNQADPWQEQRYIVPDLDRREVAQLIASKDFSERNLLSLSAANRNLSGLNAVNALLRNADFARSDLTNANFTGANLSNANFQSANLEGARLQGADLEGANLIGANLQGADLSGASLIGSSFFDPDQGESSGARFDAATRLTAAEISPLFPVQLGYVQRVLQSIK